MRYGSDFCEALELYLDEQRAAIGLAAQRIGMLTDSDLELKLGQALILADPRFGPAIVTPNEKGAPIGHGFYIVPQFRVLNYRSDFALFLRSGGVGVRLLVEADGAYWHIRNSDQMERDSARDTALMRAGWPVTRFSEAQIKDDAAECAAAAWERLYAGWLLRARCTKEFAESAA